MVMCKGCSLRASQPGCTAPAATPVTAPTQQCQNSTEGCSCPTPTPQTHLKAPGCTQLGCVEWWYQLSPSSSIVHQHIHNGKLQQCCSEVCCMPYGNWACIMHGMMPYASMDRSNTPPPPSRGTHGARQAPPHIHGTTTALPRDTWRKEDTTRPHSACTNIG
jgi:hypothetical protein